MDNYLSKGRIKDGHYMNNNKLNFFKKLQSVNGDMRIAMLCCPHCVRIAMQRRRENPATHHSKFEPPNVSMSSNCGEVGRGGRINNIVEIPLIT